jgi:hypothetical protein
MSVPMLGTWTVQVVAVNPFSIHGNIYYELHVQRVDAPETVTILRVPQHATEGQPSPGDRLSVKFIMGQVTSAKRAT